MMCAMPSREVAKRSLRDRQQALIRRERLGYPMDRDELAAVLFDTARQQLRIRRMPVPLDADEDVANRAAARAVDAHEKRDQSVAALFRGLFALFVESAAIDVARVAKVLPRPFSAYEHDDEGNSIIELASVSARGLDEQVDDRDALRGVIASYPELAEHLSGAPPRVQLIAAYALEGRSRRDIAELVSPSLGAPVKEALVRQIIRRQLSEPFPHLRFLWENAKTSSSDETDKDREARIVERRAAADMAFTAHLEHASRLTRAIASVRDALGDRRSDWTAVAAALQESQGRGITSAESKRTWERFVVTLPEEARGADR